MERFQAAAGRVIKQREPAAHQDDLQSDRIYFHKIKDTDFYYKTTSRNFTPSEDFDEAVRSGYEIYSRDRNAELRMRSVREFFKHAKSLEPSLLGIYNAKKKKVLNIIRTTIGFNAAALRRDAGDSYSSIVEEEEITAKLRIPTQGPTLTEEEVRQGLTALWVSKGIAEDRIPERLQIKTTPNVNTELLKKMEESEEITLSPETRIKGLAVRMDSAETVTIPYGKSPEPAKPLS